MKRFRNPSVEDVKTASRKKKHTSSITAEAANLSKSSHSQNGDGGVACGYTVSVALPGSILATSQSSELKTYLVGQVARALVIFNVHEVVIFNEQGPSFQSGSRARHQQGDPNWFMAKILQFLETPQYLRRHLFPVHPDLKFAGLLNPLDCPHHMRQDDLCPFREGVVLNDSTHLSRSSTHSLVDCGLDQDVLVDKKLMEGVRVTVHMDYHNLTGVKGYVVAPSAPWTEGGIYWGYQVRMASSFGAVFTESPYPDGYDLTIGTSERGENIDHLQHFNPFKHVLVVLGGVRGLEFCLEHDQELHVDDVSLLFDHYLNLCPGQGSRTIRTEEALLVLLSSLRPKFAQANNRTNFSTAN